ncbi:MAG: Crp/Fnr family transcriptional regulator [Erysipelothrix sp.]|jgi:CRP-like cAMP-binding protein|nr:Crp/Fnr family transcriptional regulator [Erysipelothrix sp.]
MIHILRKCSLFAGLSPQELDHFIACKKPVVKTYYSRDIIFAEDSYIKEIGVIITGEALISKTDFYGNENIILHLKEADSFGEAIALAQHEPSRVNVIAKTQTVIAFFDISQFITGCQMFCSYHQKINENLLQVLAKKLIELHKKVDTLSKRSIRDKLLEYLNYCPKVESNIALIPFSRQELANYLNVDRSALAREMKSMIDDEIIKVEGKRIIFLNL